MLSAAAEHWKTKRSLSAHGAELWAELYEHKKFLHTDKEEEEVSKEDNEEGNTYNCDSCKYETKTKRNLASHQKSIHEENSPQLCDSCPYITRNKSHMKKHREAVHLGIKYPCVSCEYRATDKSSLKRHRKTIHEGKKVIRTEVFDKDRFYAEVVAEFEKEQRSLVDIEVDWRKKFAYSAI